MRKGASLVVTAVVALAVMFIAGNRSASVQGQGQVQSVAAVPGEKGGQNIFGGYDVADWPKPLTDLPGHGDWTWGAGQSVFAESPRSRLRAAARRAADDSRTARESGCGAEHQLPDRPPSDP